MAIDLPEDNVHTQRKSQEQILLVRNESEVREPFVKQAENQDRFVFGQ